MTKYKNIEQFNENGSIRANMIQFRYVALTFTLEIYVCVYMYNTNICIFKFIKFINSHIKYVF